MRFLLANVETVWASLAAELARRQPGLSHEKAEQSARRVTEWLVFLRGCEARGVALPPNVSMLSGDTEGCPAWDELVELGQQRLEAGLGDPLRTAPVEALGQVHERLLGLRLRWGRQGRTAVEKHSQSRKTSGAFYTPSYICQYMAERVLAGESRPDDLRILDPSCGGGAFLLAVCRYLRHGGKRLGATVEPWRLASWLHGVDLDAEAILAARRSLWLELAEAVPDWPRWSQRVAEQLGVNLCCGDVLADDSRDRAGRFDVVVGNPPYRRELGTKPFLDRLAATALGRRVRMPRMDLWYYFLHRGLELLRPGGRLSFIVGSYWTTGRGARKLIAELRETAHIEEIFSLGRLRVFERVVGQHMILTVSKGPCPKPTTIRVVGQHPADDAEPFVRGLAPILVFGKSAAQLFRGDAVDLEPPCDELLGKLAGHAPLAEFGMVRQGIAENPASVTRRAIEQHAGQWRVGEGVFVLTAEELARLDLSEQEAALIRPYHDLCDLGRYWLASEPSRRLIYTTAATCPDIDQYPVLRRHLSRFRPLMEARRETRQGTRGWWQLHWPRDEALWQAGKLLCVQMAPRPALVPAPSPVYVPFSVNVFVPSGGKEHLNYFAALLNSRLLWKWFRHHAKRRGVGLEINGHVLARAPIRRIDFASPGDRARHDRLVDLAEARVRLNREGEKKVSSAASEPDEQAIDQLVYELYGLSDDEIRQISGESWERMLE
jgi:adenine-specific DNA-methyltransferase